MIRPIHPNDNPALASIIHAVLAEFDADKPGFASHDPEVSDMAAAYASDKHAFFVLQGEDDAILGGGGVAPLQGGEPHQCEIRKMYLLPEARGKGWGRKLFVYLLNTAKELGYTQAYIETLHRMNVANAIYQRYGCQLLDAPLGNTGHCGCDVWYVKELS